MENRNRNRSTYNNKEMQEQVANEQPNKNQRGNNKRKNTRMQNRPGETQDKLRQPQQQISQVSTNRSIRDNKALSAKQEETLAEE